ncbi:MAG: transposase, partial [Acidobacteria bacterium]|nr:transposase [Acidobacteriota bacterium]
MRQPGHPFYERLNELLEEAGLDGFVEERCRRFYAPTMGRPSLAPGMYFRLLLIGYFEGLGSERGMAWRAADSLGLRRFLRIGLE